MRDAMFFFRRNLLALFRRHGLGCTKGRAVASAEEGGVHLILYTCKYIYIYYIYIYYQ